MRRRSSFSCIETYLALYDVHLISHLLPLLLLFLLLLLLFLLLILLQLQVHKAEAG